MPTVNDPELIVIFGENNAKEAVKQELAELKNAAGLDRQVYLRSSPVGVDRTVNWGVIERGMTTRVLAFDFAKDNSLAELEEILKDVVRVTQSVPGALIGINRDPANPQISDHEIKEFARKHNLAVMTGSAILHRKNHGEFIPTYTNFKKQNNQTQARQILQTARELLAQPGNQGKKVGITYSANHDQTIQIKQMYDSGKAITGIKGNNQAAVMMEVEKLLKKEYKELQGRFQILPITTCAHGGGKGDTTEEWVVDDLAHIEGFLARTNIVLGWQNQTTYNTNMPFAVGGDIATVPPALNKRIQDRLMDFQHMEECRSTVILMHNVDTYQGIIGFSKEECNEILKAPEDQNAPSPEPHRHKPSFFQSIAKAIKGSDPEQTKGEEAARENKPGS